MMRSVSVLWVVLGCARPTPPAVIAKPAPAKPAPAKPAPAKPTLAEEVLEIEALILPTEPGSKQFLRALSSDVRRRLATEAPTLAALPEPDRAEKTLASIEAVLIDHHFVYPGVGYVAAFHDGVTEVTVDELGKATLLARSENASQARQQMIKRSSTFHIADCDIYSLLYVSLGEELGLPISMVDLPDGPAGGVAHNYVVWRLADGNLVRWEADAGEMRTEFSDQYHYDATTELTRERAQQLHISAVPMTRDEVLGYVHWAVGLTWSDRGVDHLTLEAYERALSMWTSPKVLNSIAWLLATSPNPKLRDSKRAIAYGEKLAELWPTASFLDTVAAAYAAAGRWADAVAMQRRAKKAANDKERASFDERLTMFERCQPYYEARANERSASSMRGALTDSGWGKLQIDNWKPSPVKVELANRCP